MRGAGSHPAPLRYPDPPLGPEKSGPNSDFIPTHPDQLVGQFKYTHTVHIHTTSYSNNKLKTCNQEMFNKILLSLLDFT